jgi:hypothetical protein
MKTEDGRLVVVAGASRSGKTAYVVKMVRGQSRVIVWDVEDQWSALPGFKRITSRADLLAAINKRGPAKLAYVAGGDIKSEFNYWAGCVFYWARFCGPCIAVAEELADVTTPAKAPGDWGILLRRGLKRGATIYAISQRWAEADKTAIGNASEFVVFRASGEDVAYMSKKTRIPIAEIERLMPLDYVTQKVTGEFSRGRLKF